MLILKLCQLIAPPRNRLSLAIMPKTKQHSSLPRSPLAPKHFARPNHIGGVRLAVGASTNHKKDVLFVALDAKTNAAGVFTRSQTPAAPVDLCRAHLQASKGRVRGLVVNAGNANAFTGKKGARAAKLMAQSAADVLPNAALHHIMVASTGVIGVDLDPAPIMHIVAQAKLPAKQNWQAAAKAIMTTDTFPKAARREAKFGKHKVQLGAIAKGSGMVAPDMATVLAFIFTDAAIPTAILQKLLSAANAKTLNAISVDSDTSTSDSCLLFATGQKLLGGGALRSVDDVRLRGFRRALEDIMRDIAIQIVSDGEGISRLMTIDVRGAADDGAARRIGLAIGNSPLVKTAVAGGDANWGRIVMAIGKSGEAVSRDNLAIDIGGHIVARSGRVAAAYKEALITQHLRTRQVHISVDVGVRLKNKTKAKGKARVWASDLTHGYVAINADYRS